MIFLSIILMYSALQCAVSTVALLQRMRRVIRRGSLFDRTGLAVVVLLNIVAITTVTAMAIGLVW
jgi:hypothetical protein